MTSTPSGFTAWCATVVIVGWAGAAYAQPAPSNQSCSVEAITTDGTLPGHGLPARRSLVYRMDGRIRFWPFSDGKDNIGGGRVVWRGDAAGAAALELLVGTNPDRAPMRLNRWGYIAEEHRQERTRTFGVMHADNEDSNPSDLGARTRSSHDVTFRVIQAIVLEDQACAVTGIMRSGGDPTFDELSSVVSQVATKVEREPVRTVDIGASARPGFLGAVEELVGRVLVDPTARPVPSDRRLHVRYFHSRVVYDLAMLEVKDVTPRGGRPREQVLVRFEVRSPTGNRKRFELEFATTGPMAGAPRVIRYQPHWWFSAVLTLEAPVGPPPSARGNPSGPLARPERIR